jgi:flagellar hook-associated protein 2
MAEAAINGLNSGLDTAAIIDGLVSLQRRPIDITIAKRDLEIEKLASFEDLKSRLLTFKSQVTEINTESEFLSIAGNFSNNSSSSTNTVANVTTTSAASSGTFSLTVNQLAQEGKITSGGFSSLTDEIAQGTFQITVGDTTTLIEINSTNNTIDGLRLAINNSGIDANATFLNDGDSSNPIRLVISGTKTGADNGVSAQLFHSVIGGGLVEAIPFTETQTAQDAIIVVDGVQATKSSNTVTDVINGTTLNLQSAGSGIITLQTDSQAITDKVGAFIEGYNDLMAFLNSELFFDPDTNFTGTLFGNFTTQNLQSTLRNVISSTLEGVTGDFQYLSQVGITTQDSGLLLLDEGDFADSLNQDIGNVSQLFSSQGITTNSNVTFVGATDDTVAGTYDLRVLNGVPQLSKTGANDYTDATGSGTFYAGAAGTDAEGLNFRIATLTDGDYGTITFAAGVAETLNRELANLTDSSREGPLVAEIDTVTSTIEDFDETITDQEGRIELFEENLKARFSNLEVVVGRLNSQRDAFAGALAGIQSAFERR